MLVDKTLKNYIERDAKKDMLGFPTHTQTELFGVTIKPSFSLPFCLPGSLKENKEKDIPVDENDDR